ncbi:MAG: protein phosphatase 2C domain-containing protein [Clostridia bacterium]|nr:protein phosphatase 2C domain-containing protein [Clostridia bacterium]
MKITRQGCAHYTNGMNNQDFCYLDQNLKMVLDGCSEAQYSEVGTRLFIQVFSTLPDRAKVECFEENVKKTFDELLEMFKKWFTTKEAVEEFIMDNLLFTIVACFEMEDSFIVKMFGDGYIVTVNKNDKVSYLKFFYGKRPPYFAYKYCELLEDNIFKDYHFKTFTFSKKEFQKVGVASDGIQPIAKGDIKTDFDTLIVSKVESEYGAEGIILANNHLFKDDITILI